MDIKNLNRTASFKQGGHTVITVKISLPRPEGDGVCEQRIRDFYSRLCERYTALAKSIATEHGEEIWASNRRPIVLSVGYEIGEASLLKKKGKRGKTRNGYSFLRTERVYGPGKEVKKRTETDFFLEDSGLLFC